MQTVYTFDDRCVSDLHKDAYGFRPDRSFWLFWESATNDEKQEEWTQLINAMDVREARRIEDEKACVVRFEKLVTKTMLAGAATREDAIRWLMDGEDVRGDAEFFEYLMGIPYGYTATDGHLSYC